MKGRIMRIENGKFYIITEKGDFVSADAVDGFECGDEVEVKNELMPSYFKPIASIAAAVIIVFGGIYGYHVPVRYVDVCINPEIQLSLNVFDRVVKVQGKNSDGRKIASAKKLKNENVTQAIGDIVSSARTLGYMSNGDEGERDVIVSVFGSGADELSKKIPLDNVRVVDEDDCEMAKKQDIPVGKYVLMNELAEADETQSIEKVKDMSVKQIIDRINDVKKSDKPVQTPPPVSAQPTAAPIETPDVSEPTAQPQEQTIKRSAPLAEIIHKPTIAPSKTASSSKSSSSKSTAKSSSKTNTSSSKSSKAKTTSSPTAKPSSSPSAPAGALSPTENPKATLLPSFDNVTRPAANSDKSTDKNTSSAADKNDSSVNTDKNNTNKQQPSGNSDSQNPPSVPKQNEPPEEKQENKPQTSNGQKTPGRPTESVNQPPQNTSAQKEQPQTKPSGGESSANSGSQERNESTKPKEASSRGGAELQSSSSSKTPDKPSPSSQKSDNKPSAPRADSAKQPSNGSENRGGGNGGSPQGGNNSGGNRP